MGQLKIRIRNLEHELEKAGVAKRGSSSSAHSSQSSLLSATAYRKEKSESSKVGVGPNGWPPEGDVGQSAASEES